MLQFEELRLQLLGQKEKLNQLREALGLQAATKEIEALEIAQHQFIHWHRSMKLKRGTRLIKIVKLLHRLNVIALA